MEDSDRRVRLGRFLRSCRERTDPHRFGVGSGNRRRTPGLRREEVAALTGISPAYYTKIEQGRVDVSPHVLDALAGFYELSHTEREYVFALANDYGSVGGRLVAESMNPALEHLLASLDPFPAQILNHRWDIIGWNDATSAALYDFGELPSKSRNLLAMMFLVPQQRSVIDDWEGNAQRMLAEFRADYGRYHHDPEFEDLVTFLQASSPEFDAWWSDMPRIGAPGNAAKTIYHPTAGPLRLQEMVLGVHDYPGLRMILFLPHDEVNKQKLQQLLDDRRSSQVGTDADGTAASTASAH